ncbi:MAG TPA: aldehyde-activating protein [Candidatus Binatia bacterium]|nr:aldehyde-activating protein [Candidatus Binatia bacterium]
MKLHAGGCHCGNLRYELRSASAAAQLPRRACQCSFCRAHGAVSTSDPQGTLHFTVRDPASLLRYRFGLKLADFLICGACGVYVAAQMREGDGAWAVLNVNTMDEVDAFAGPADSMDYGSEDAAARIARRKSRWTPVTAPA